MMGEEQIKRYELQTLRTFRDTWMKGSKEGQKSIETYYDTAPKIVSAINDIGES